MLGWDLARQGIRQVLFSALAGEVVEQRARARPEGDVAGAGENGV